MVVAIVVALSTWPWPAATVTAQTPTCTTSWIGPSTGFASFGQASFWSTGTAPTAADLVCFPATAAGVTFQRVSATVAGWDVAPGGVVTFQGGTVTVTGAADLGGMDLVGSSRFIVGPDSGVGEEEKLRISSGTVDPTLARLTFTIPESAAVSVDEGSATFGLDVDNQGTLSSNVEFGSLGLRPGTTLRNSGEILLSGRTTISALTGPPGTPVGEVHNLSGGTIVADGPPFTPLASVGLGDAARITGVTFRNDGLFHARSGQAVLGSNGVHSGGFVVDAGAQLGLEGTSNTFGPGSSVTGGGLVRVAVFLVGTTITSVNIDAAATFEPAEFHITSGRVAIGGDRTLPVLRFRSGGRLDVNGDARVNGLLAAQPNETFVLAGSGTLTIPDGAAMTMSGGNALFVRDTLSIVNEGEIRQDGPGIRMEGPTSITNRGRWTVTQSADIGLGDEGRLRNDGLITIDGPADAQLLMGPASTFDNPGTIELRSGRIDQRGNRVTQLSGRTLTGGTWSVADGATWIFFPRVDAIGAGATVALNGSGRIDQDVNRRSPTLAALGRVDGTLRLTGGAALSTTQPLAVAGSVVLDPTSSLTAPAITMAPTATLQTSLGQTSTGTPTSGRLVTPNAAIAGTLAIRSTDATAPGRSLVVEAARVTGTFATIDRDATTASATVERVDEGLEIRLGSVTPPTTTTTTTVPPTTTTTTVPPTTTTTTTVPPTTTTTTVPPTSTTTTTVPPTTTTTTVPDPFGGAGLGELFDALYGDLPRWVQSLDPADLPVLADDAAAALGLDELAQLEPPDLSDVGDDLAAVAAALEDAGCSIDWVAGVPGQPTPPDDGDLIQARCERSVEPASTPLFDGDDLLDGLATDVAVTAGGEFETAVALRAVVGIDATGPYVLAETGVEAQFGGTVTITGTADAADGPTVLTGTVGPDLTTTLTLGDDLTRRVRPSELSAVSVTPAIEGTIDTAIAFATGPFTLDWDGSWTVATTDGDVEVTAGVQEVSGAFVSEIGNVDVNGVRAADGTWTVDAEVAAEPSELDGFALERLTVNAVITPTSITGSGSLDVVVNVAGPDGSTQPFSVPSEVSFDDDGIEVASRFLLDDLAIGEPAVLWLERVALVVEIRVDLAPASASIVVTLDGEADGTLLPAGRPGGLVIFPTGPLPPAPGVEVNGSIVIEDFVAELSSDGSFDLTAATAAGSAGGVVDLDLVVLDVAIRSTGAAVVTIGSATGTLPGVEGLALTIEGITFDSAVPSFGFTRVIVETAIDGQLLDLQGVLPFEARVTAVFEDPDNLANVSIAAEGSFDLTLFDELPFTPVIEVGGREVTLEDNSFQFSIAIVDGVIRPIDIADITLGFENLQISEKIGVGGEIRLGGIVDGVPTNIAGGSISIRAGLDEVEGELDTSLDGTITRTATGGRIELDGTTTVSATFTGTGIEVEDLALDYDVVITRAGDDFDIDVRLEELNVGLLTIPIGNLMTFSGSTQLNLTPDPGEPIAEFDNVGLRVEFVDLEPLAGWAASVTNFAIGSDLRPYALEGFAIDVDIPPGASAGLPDWLPLTIEEAGLTFPSIVEDLLGELPLDGVVRGGIEIVDLLDARVRISGGLNIRIGEGDELFGVDASVDGLEIDLGELAAGRPPFTDLQGAGIGVEPFEIAGARIGGSLGLGVVDVGDQQVFYVEVEGVAEIGGIGGGVQLLLTEYGPLLAEISAPLGVPIGATGVVLAGARGGIRWGGGPAPEPVNPDDPAGLLALPIFDDLGDFEIDPDEIPALVAAAVDRQVPTWETGATLALSGTFTHVAAPGIISGAATVAANIADDGTLDLFGKGDLDIYGFGVGETGIRLSFADPAAPALQFALVSPPTDSVFAVVLPARAEAAAVLDTTGLSDGVALALRAFVVSLRDDTLEAGNAYFGQLIDLVATTLDDDRVRGGGRPLTIAVLDTNANGRIDPAEQREITGDLLVDRLVALLPDDDVGSSTARVARLVMALQSELAAASASSTIVPPAPESTLGLEALLAAGDDAAAAFVDAVRNASRDAVRTFLDVADPRFVLTGSLQPVFLGIPFGDPEAEVELTISKAGVGMRVGVSIIGLLSDACENVTIGFCKLLTFPLGVLYQDFVVASFELPGTDVLDALVDGTLEEAFDAASVWGVTFEGSVGMLGMKMVELSGLVVPPGNRAFVDQRTQRLDQPSPVNAPATGRRFDPADSSRPVPIMETEHYNNLVEFGGLVVTGNLRAPELLVDPIGLFDRLDLEPPADPLEIPAFLSTIAQSIGDEVSPGFVQMYIPGDPLAVPTASHIVAEWNVDVLSVPIGDGTLTVTPDGAEIEAFVPYLGAQGSVLVKPAAIVDGLPVPITIPDPVGALASLLAGEPSTVTTVPDPSAPLVASAFADVFDADATGPAPANAYLLALLSGGVYVEAHEPGGFVDEFAADAHAMGLGDVTFIENALTDTELVAARSDDATVIVFRGTEPSEPGVDGALVDGSFGLRNQSTPAGTVGVHAGFWQAVDSVYDDVVDYIEASGDRRVWLTGHSLGGSLAVVTALRLAADGYDVAGVQSIGAPNVGGQSFTTVYDRLGLGARTQRWVNDRDLVPMLLDPIAGYTEVGSANVFVRGPGDTFEARLDTDDPPPFEGGFGIDDHDSALYATRILSLVEPSVVDALPEVPDVTTQLFDTDDVLALLHTFGAPLEDMVRVLDAAGLAPPVAAQLLESSGLPTPIAAALLRAVYDLAPEVTAQVLAAVGGLGIAEVGLAVWQAYVLSRDEIAQLVTDFGATSDDVQALLAAIAAEPGLLFPRVEVEVELSGRALDRGLEDIGVPAQFRVPPERLAGNGLFFRAFSPYFDPDAVDDAGRPDLVRRRGGLQFEARTNIPGLVEEARAVFEMTGGALGSLPGFRATLDVDELRPIGGIRVREAAVSIEGSALGAVRVDVFGSANLFGTEVTVEGELDGAGAGSLRLLTEGPIDLGAVQLDGSFEVEVDRGRGSLQFDGTVQTTSRWLGAASVEASGRISEDGSFDFALGLARLDLGPVRLSDDPTTPQPLVRLRRSAGGVITFGFDARLDVPGAGLPLASATGTLDSQGFGSLTTRFGNGVNVPLRWGPIEVGGTFRFTRSAVGSAVVSEFEAINARVAFGDLVEQTVPLVRISTDGRFTAQLPGGAIGSGNRIRVSHSGLRVAVDAGGLDARLTILDPFVAIPALAEPASRLGISDGRIRAESFTIRTADFSVPLVDLRSFELGPVSINGALLFERSGGEFQVRVTAGSDPATLRIDRFADVEVTPFTIRSDGSFTPISVDVGQFGTPQLAIRNARIKVSKPTTALSSFRVRIVGGQLVLPVGDPFDLPTLTITAEQGFDQLLYTPDLDLGPLLRFTSRAVSGPDDPQFPDNRIVWRLALEDGVVRFELVEAPSPLNRPTVSLLAGSFNSQLRSLEIASDGTFNGRIRSSVQLFGQRLATVSYSISRNAAGIVTLQTTAPAEYNFGFVEAQMSGNLNSTGAFSFTGSASVDDGVCPAACVDGQVTMNIRDSGITGTFSGEACLAVCGGVVGGRVTNRGVVSGTIVVGDLFQPFEFTLGGGPGADTTAPTFVQNPLLDLTFRAAIPASSDPRSRVNYVLPRATDNRPGTPSVVCTPASGTLFRVGTTEVTCVARDAAGNPRTRRFDVILIDEDETLPVLATPPGGQITATADDMTPNLEVRATLFSEPVDLGEFMADANGTVTVTVTVPDDVTPGEHQLVLTGLTPDGNLNSVAFAVTVLDPAASPPAPTPGVPPAVGPPFDAAPASPADPVVSPFRPAPAQAPGGALPATGSDGVGRVLALGAALAALGLLLWLTSRRRLPGRRPHPT
jgi:hypothetical protein